MLRIEEVLGVRKSGQTMTEVCIDWAFCGEKACHVIILFGQPMSDKITYIQSA